MRILVVGGTGFIGPDVVRLLCESAHGVTIFHRGEHEAELPREVQHLHGPLERLGALVPGRYDAAIGMRLMTEADARAFAAGVRGRVDRAVVISSADVYRAYGRLRGTEPGPPEPMPLTEDAPLRERLYPYGGEHAPRGVPATPWLHEYDKILVERLVREMLGATVLRLGMVHGPRSYRYWEHLRRMEHGRPAILLGAAQAALRGTRAYGEDVARAIVLAATREPSSGRTYNVGEREPMEEAELVRALADAAGWPGKITVVPRASIPDELAPHLPQPLTWDEREHHLVIDSSRIRHELGYRERVTREEGFRRTVTWLRANPRAETSPIDYAAEDALLARV